MGKRASFADVIDMKEIFEKYMDNVNFDSIQSIADVLRLSLKNRVLEERVDVLENEVFHLKAKKDVSEVK